MTKEEIPDIQPVGYAHRHRGTCRQTETYTRTHTKENETVSLTNNIQGMFLI